MAHARRVALPLDWIAVPFPARLDADRAARCGDGEPDVGYVARGKVERVRDARLRLDAHRIAGREDGDVRLFADSGHRHDERAQSIV